ncbi:MAG: hypothetical protein ACTHLN_15990 [Tepidisphaeraceae bacterium]
MSHVASRYASMTVQESEVPHPDLPAPDEEPFGQAGIRKHAGRIIAWLCVIVVCFSLAMDHRSRLFDDTLQWRAPDGVITISSVYGRILVRGSVSAAGLRRAGPGWSYHARFAHGIIDGWEPSLLKTIGFEVSTDPLPGDPAGFWVRIKWSFIAVLFSLQPIWRVVVAFVRWRHYRTAR